MCSGGVTTVTVTPQVVIWYKPTAHMGLALDQVDGVLVSDPDLLEPGAEQTVEGADLPLGQQEMDIVIDQCLARLLGAGAALSIRLYLTARYADNPGTDFWWRLEQNLELLQTPGWALFHLAGVVLLAWLCMRGWRTCPLLLRQAFAVLFPVMSILYLLLGWAGEIRVFIELFPVLWGLARFR